MLHKHMKRTTIYLEPELEVLLKLEMQRQKRPMAEIVREAVYAYLRSSPRRVDAAVVAIAESLGLSRVATTDRRHFEPLAAALSIEIVP